MKSVLLITPEFFNFHTSIRERLEGLGYRVYFVADRPSKNPFVKILIRKARFLMAPYLYWVYRRKFTDVPVDVNEVFIIKGEGLVPPVVKFLRERFSKARFQLFLWDSVKNSPGSHFLMKNIQPAQTFDFLDAQKYRELRFIPNFFIASKDELEVADRAKIETKWDLTFVGTVHSDRLKVIKKLTRSLPEGVRFYRFLFFQSIVLYLFRKWFDPAFKFFPPKELTRIPMYGKPLEDILSASGTILDIHHPGQTGLTARAIKSLAMGQRLLTTNETIREFPFYDERYVRVIDRENPTVDIDFLRQPPPPPHPEALALELTSWLRKYWGF